MKLDDLKARLVARVSITGSLEERRAGNKTMLEAATAITDLEAMVGELGEALQEALSWWTWCLENALDPADTPECWTTKARATLAKLEKARGKDQTDG